MPNHAGLGGGGESETMTLRAAPEACERAANACVRAYRSIDEALCNVLQGGGLREAVTLLRTAIQELEAANHSIVGSSSEMKRARRFLAEIARLEKWSGAQ